MTVERIKVKNDIPWYIRFYRYKLINSKIFEFELLTNFTTITLGITFGSNKFVEGLPVNFILGIDFLFFCFELEIKWESKNK